MDFQKPIIGEGIYSPREVARYVGTTSANILRWTRGSGASPPLWSNYYIELDDDTELNFRDLIEAMVVSRFRQQGVSMQKIRYAVKLARNEFRTDYPLSHRSFVTDGERILVEADGDKEFTSLDKREGLQKTFREVIKPSLLNIQYENAEPALWRPSIGDGAVVLDPNRSFGASILDNFGVSTEVLANEFEQFDDTTYLSEIYEIPEKHVISAINFEYKLDGKNPIRPQYAA